MTGFVVAGISVSRKLMLSGVCPGVCKTSNVKLPNFIIPPFFRPLWGNSYCQSLPPSAERNSSAPVSFANSLEPARKSACM